MHTKQDVLQVDHQKLSIIGGTKSQSVNLLVAQKEKDGGVSQNQEGPCLGTMLVALEEMFVVDIKT